MKHKFSLDAVSKQLSIIKNASLVFLYGEVGAGKTTLISSYIAHSLGKSEADITSPTYVYYNMYQDIVHFDLYRLRDYDTFVSIGGEEILDNNTGIIFVEWPELLERYYIPDYKIYLRYVPGEENTREIEIISCIK